MGSPDGRAVVGVVGNLKSENPTISEKASDTASPRSSSTVEPGSTENTEKSPTDDETHASPPPQSDEVAALKARISELAAIRVAAGG